MINLVQGSVQVTARVLGDLYATHAGLLTGPRGGNSPSVAIAHGAKWAMDNDCFNQFDPSAILRMYQRYQSYAEHCLFALAPDVVCDAEQTLIRFAWWQPVIKMYGYPAGLAIQNGQENYDILWDKLDAVFIAGDDVFKLSPYAAGVAREAKRRGKWVHMGRVNSNRRVMYAHSIDCDSFDGTGYARFKNQRLIEPVAYQKHKQLRMF